MGESWMCTRKIMSLSKTNTIRGFIFWKKKNEASSYRIAQNMLILMRIIQICQCNTFPIEKPLYVANFRKSFSFQESKAQHLTRRIEQLILLSQLFVRTWICGFCWFCQIQFDAYISHIKYLNICQRIIIVTETYFPRFFRFFRFFTSCATIWQISLFLSFTLHMLFQTFRSRKR